MATVTPMTSAFEGRRTHLDVGPLLESADDKMRQEPAEHPDQPQEYVSRADRGVADGGDPAGEAIASVQQGTPAPGELIELSR